MLKKYKIRKGKKTEIYQVLLRFEPVLLEPNDIT